MGEQMMMAVEYVRARARVRGRTHYKRHAAAQRERVASWRKANPEKDKASLEKYRCKNAVKLRARGREQYQSNPNRRASMLAYRRDHPDRVIESRRRFEDSNRERMAVYRSKWKRDNAALVCLYTRRRRDLQLGLENTLTIVEWKAILREHGWSCCYCGTIDAQITMDHLLPVLLNGSTSKQNIVPACGSCNSAKSSKTLAEFLWWRAKRGDHRVCRMRIGA